MTNKPTAPWPRDMVVLRWVFVIASLACVAQAILALNGHRRAPEPEIDMYYTAVVLFLTCAACFSAWVKRSRAFVLLALGSQLLNVFMAGFYVLFGVTALVDTGWPALPHVLPGTIWNLIVFVFAMFIVAYSTRRYVSIKAPLSDS